MIRKAGAQEIHLRIACRWMEPAITASTPRNGRLIGATHTLDETRSICGGFAPYLIEDCCAVGNGRRVRTACFSGKYPIRWSGQMLVNLAKDIEAENAVTWRKSPWKTLLNRPRCEEIKDGVSAGTHHASSPSPPESRGRYPREVCGFKSTARLTPILIPPYAFP